MTDLQVKLFSLSLICFVVGLAFGFVWAGFAKIKSVAREDFS